MHHIIYMHVDMYTQKDVTHTFIDIRMYIHRARNSSLPSVIFQTKHEYG